MPNPVSEPSLRRVFVRFAGFGAGAVLALGLLRGAVVWFASRPRPPEPWNSTAITASFDDVSTEGDASTLVFSYVLENKTQVDYRLESQQVLLLQLKKEKILSQQDTGLSIELPIFLPSGRRQRVQIHVSVSCPEREIENPTAQQRDAHRKAVAKYVRDEMPNLDGFTLFDRSSHYEIRLPRGW